MDARSGIKPIETSYRGFRFRSRTEARYAVFFDALGVRWEYEKQGYALPSGPYLPDFWLPDFGAWMEIKAERPTERESDLAFELAHFTRNRVYIFYGQVPGRDGGSGEIFSPGDLDAPGFRDWDNAQAFCVCTTCGKVGIEFEARSDRMPCKQRSLCPRSDHGDRGHSGDQQLIIDAVCAARSARFEHGESPII